MSCSNIGGRKNRNIRDHLFVVNGIINDVINNKQSKEVDLKIYDVAKCFDKLEYHNTANDLFNAGVNNDKFVTIANSNMKCDVAIKTPWGVTERTSFEKIEMQGTVLAGLKCSISIDTLGKEYLQNAHGPNYLYKNCVPVPPLSFVDDIVGVSLCDDSSKERLKLSSWSLAIPSVSKCMWENTVITATHSQFMVRKCLPHKVRNTWGISSLPQET